jgi:hypothetical protein
MVEHFACMGTLPSVDSHPLPSNRAGQKNLNEARDQIFHGRAARQFPILHRCTHYWHSLEFVDGERQWITNYCRAIIYLSSSLLIRGQNGSQPPKGVGEAPFVCKGCSAGHSAYCFVVSGYQKGRREQQKAVHHTTRKQEAENEAQAAVLR